jgi:transcriptional antiterminator RfaH
VPENLINAIRRRVGEIEAAGGETLAGLKYGDPVVIREGPFAGYQAIFDARLSGDDRVRVLLSLLSRQQLPLELPGAYIAPQKQA